MSWLERTIITVVITASATVPVTGHAKAIGIFPGDDRVFPISLTGDLCVPAEPDAGHRAIMQAITAFNPKGDDLEACWDFATVAGSKPKSVIITCLRERGCRDGSPWVGQCMWLDKYRFLEPAIVPRSAF
jgi:hypothetical protein